MGNLFPHVAPQTQESYESCNSPDCVRCNKYRKLIEAVPCKLAEFKGVYPDTDVSERFMSSVEDQESVMADLKTGDNTHQHPNVFYLKDLSAKSVWKNSDFAQDSDNLILSHPAILKEFWSIYDNLQKGKVEGWVTNSTPHGMWCVFHLVNQGRVIEDSCRRCPNTLLALQQCPAWMKNSVFGNASFSVIYPGTHITPHYGPTNLRLRCHLGLQVPENCCLIVEGKDCVWSEGQCLIFDDSYLHEVRYDHLKEDSEPRAVFMVDLWHPEVNQEERDVINFVFKGD